MFDWIGDPAAWAALGSLILLEIVLGVDNLIFISVVANRLPPEQQPLARRIGISLALVMRLALLTTLAWLTGLTATVFDLGIVGATGEHGVPSFETAFSWRDLILIAGGLFLVWKATTSIHDRVDPEPATAGLKQTRSRFAITIVQIILLDLVFSVDSILTAVGMTDRLPIMIIAVVVAVAVMFIAADAVARFIENNPTIVMLALAFLLTIGVMLIADGFGRHVPKGYIYTAITFAMFVEFLNMLSRRRGLTGRPQR